MTKEGLETVDTVETLEVVERGAEASAGPASAGRQLGSWRLEAPLGRGAQGRTFQASHVTTGAKAAIKILDVAELADWKPYELFDRERAALEALSHPGVPAFLDAGTSEGERWIAMELMEGEPLSERIRRQRPTRPEALVDLLDQALDVLEHLHGASPPIIHRDLKPSNLIVSGAGRLAIVDFGSVRSRLRTDGGSTMAGTFGYLAPEQLHGEATARTDLYSLGVAFAAVAAGVEGRELPRRGLRVEVDRLVEHPALRAALGAMTEPDPERRPESAAAARALLASSGASPGGLAGESSPPVGAPARSGPGNPFSLVFWMVIALIALIGSTIVGLVARGVTRSQDRQRRRLEEKNQKAMAKLEERHDRQRQRIDTVRDRFAALEARARKHRERNAILPQQRPPRNPPRR